MPAPLSGLIRTMESGTTPEGRRVWNRHTTRPPLYRRPKPKRRRESTWLTQPMDQDLDLEWDLEAQDEWSRAQAQAGTVAWQWEWDEIQPEAPSLPAPPGPPEPPLPLAASRWRQCLKIRFDGATDALPNFLVQVEVHMELYEDEDKDEDKIEKEHEVGALLGGEAAGLNVGLYKGWAPKLSSFLRLMLALWWQFEDPFQVEKARARLQRIRQGTRSMADYVSEFRQLAGVIQDWPEPVKIHFFEEGLHPEVAQWALVTAELTSLVGWYAQAGEAEIWLWKVQLLK
uniref:Uncharacterized protein n=1 Tax=Sphaerodactylus townsendi TaxID=933632 RepID=A0ACB8E711_9SAUR